MFAGLRASPLGAVGARSGLYAVVTTGAMIAAAAEAVGTFPHFFAERPARARPRAASGATAATRARYTAGFQSSEAGRDCGEGESPRAGETGAGPAAAAD